MTEVWFINTFLSTRITTLQCKLEDAKNALKSPNAAVITAVFGTAKNIWMKRMNIAEVAKMQKNNHILVNIPQKTSEYI